MDIFAHGLWTFIVFFKHPKRWWALVIGMLPDVVTFVPHLFIDHNSDGGQTIYDLMYQYTHSFVIFALVIIAIYLFTKSIQWLAGAWGLHILFDIFTHPLSYYPTPYLFPLPSPFLFAVDYRASLFMIINYTLITLSILFLVLLQYRKKSK